MIRLKQSVYVSVSLLLLSAMPLDAAPFRFIGEAFDLSGQTLLYKETHDIELDDAGAYRRATVSYDDPAGQPIALKKLDYSVQPLRPELDFIDFRTTQQVTVQHDGNDLLLQTKQTDALDLVRIPFDMATTTVIDAGFDRLVDRFWDQLKEGEDLEFEFLALSRASLISFRVYRTSISETQVGLAIAPANWFLDMLMDPIALNYDRQTGRLLEYRGVTNIQALVDGEVSEDNFTAWIKYRYLDAPEDKPELESKSEVLKDKLPEYGKGATLQVTQQ